MSDLNLRKMPGVIDVIDTRHPARLDWRQAFLSIDLDEGRWFHFSILRKPDGRPEDALAACRLFKQVVNAEARALVDIAFPNRGRDVLTFSGDMIHHRMPPKFAQAGIHLSIHVDAVSQRFMQSLSNHQWLALTHAWEQLGAGQSARRKAPAR